MLFLKREIAEGIILGIWKVEESIEELYSRLDNKQWLASLQNVKSISRKLELLAARVLLKELVGEEKEICYRDSGKPFLADRSYEISISHTKGYVAFVLDKTRPIGLDIEQRTDKIFRVKDRVVTKYDFIDSENAQTHLLLHWSAKEAMFKYLDTEGVDFRRNLHVETFSPKDKGVFRVSESRTENKQSFEAHYMIDPDFVLVCLIKSDD